MRHFVYILLCADSTYYVGYTRDLERRLRQHNRCRSGARYTRTRRPVVLLHSEEYASQGEAMAREAQLKRWPRQRKARLVQQSPP